MQLDVGPGGGLEDEPGVVLERGLLDVDAGDGELPHPLRTSGTTATAAAWSSGLTAIGRRAEKKRTDE